MANGIGNGKTLAVLQQIALETNEGHSRFVIAKLRAQGLIERGRGGSWVITDAGRAALAVAS